MKLSEALRIIDDTVGMFRTFADIVQYGDLKGKFLSSHTQKGRFLLCTFSWRFVDYCLSLHHYLNNYAKKSKRKEWYGHLPRYA